MPENTKPVAPFAPERHLDLQADLHFAFDVLIREKTVLDVGAGLGKSRERIRHSTVLTYEPAPACAHLVDFAVGMALPRVQVVTAFEVLEHVQDDVAFLRVLDALAEEAVFFTTPNWHVAKCQSADHYREYTYLELKMLIERIWPGVPYMILGYFKDAEGGWVDSLDRDRVALKYVGLVNKALPLADAERVSQVTGVRWT